MSSFEGRNNLVSTLAFEERLEYKQKAFTVYDPIPLDMIYEKPFYGKVNKKGVPIYPTEINMTQLPGQGLILVHDFAAKAFNDLKNIVDYNLRTELSRFRDLFPNGFIPMSGLKNVHKLYQDHFVGAVYDVFINDYVIASRRRRIKNFDGFVREFVNFTSTVKGTLPVSRTGFIMSPFCPHAASGLIIEIADLDASDDADKQAEYLSKPSFTDYVKVAAVHGFYVDKNCPWRLAVNMDHPVTEKNMNAFGTSYKNNTVFEDYFYKSELYSFEDFKARMWYAYKSYSEDDDTASYGMLYGAKNCYAPSWAEVAAGQFKTIYREGSLELIPDDFEQEFQSKYPNSFFLPYYFEMRLAESGKRLAARQYKIKLDKILKANSMHGLERAMEILEKATMQSDIYVKNKKSKNAKYPQKIKYFGKSTTSGLHSYEERDKVTLSGFKEPESNDEVFTFGEILESEQGSVDGHDHED